jgi:hypothetical protein
MDVPKAVAVAKLCRPIIDPLGDFPEFLKHLRDAELRNNVKPFTSVAAHGFFCCIFFGIGRKPIKPKAISSVSPSPVITPAGTLNHAPTSPYENSKRGMDSERSPGAVGASPYEMSKRGDEGEDNCSPYEVSGYGNSSIKSFVDDGLGFT